MDLLNEISGFLSVPTTEVNSIIMKASDSYKKYYIKKKNGQKRTIFQPSQALKAVQYALINLYFSKLPIHHISVGYIKGLKSPLRENVKRHLSYSFTVRVDVKDFFPSITFLDLDYFLMKNGIDFLPNDKSILEKLIFPKRYISSGLPIGSPVSPIISNIVMNEIDDKIENLAKKISGDSVVTRYADDIVFSSNSFEECKTFEEELKLILEESKHPKLIINDEKTIFMSRRNRRVITGLILTPNKEISIGRKRKRYVKSLINDYKYSKLPDDRLNHLIGYLAFILDVEPTFYNSLVMKYGNIVNNIKK